MSRAAALGAEIGAQSAEGQQSAIESAVAENVMVIREHRGIAGGMRVLTETLYHELEALSGHPAEIQQLIVAVAARDPNMARELSRATSLPARIGAAKDLATTAKTLIDIERRAHNIDDGDGDDGKNPGPGVSVGADGIREIGSLIASLRAGYTGVAPPAGAGTDGPVLPAAVHPASG